MNMINYILQALGFAKKPLPEDILNLQIKLLELMPNEQIEAYRAKFSALNPEGDYSKVIPNWFIFILNDETHGVYRLANEETKVIIKSTVNILQRQIDGETVPQDELLANRRAAGRASAVLTGYDALAEYDAYSADEDVAFAAANAAAYAYSADEHAADAAADDAYDVATYNKAKHNHAIIMADKFIQLMETK